MKMSRIYKQEKRGFAISKGEPRVMSAGAFITPRKFLAAFLVFAIAFCATFCFSFFSNINIDAANISKTVPENMPPSANYDANVGYGEYRATVASDGAFEISSLADLLIAAHFYGAENESYTSFRLVRDISCAFTAGDIEELDKTFPSGWGYDTKGESALNNVLKGDVGDSVTILNSLFGDFTGTFDGNGYVIDGFNIMAGIDSVDSQIDNAGFFATIGEGAIVKDLHLRNENVVADGVQNVGGLAGTSLSNLTNVSVHGIFNVLNGKYLGGIVGVLGGDGAESSIEKAVVLGTIYADKVTFVGGAIGFSNSGNSVKDIISLMYIWSTNGDRAGGLLAFGGCVHTGVYRYITNSVCINEKYYDQDANDVLPYSTLYKYSIGGYGDDSGAYYKTKPQSTINFDVLDDFTTDRMAYVGDATNAPAPRQSMRLKDIIDVYLLQYAISQTTANVDGKTYNIYKRSPSSWLVGTADGTDENPIVIANRQGVAMLRELRFATFKLVADVYMNGAYRLDTPYRGAFFGQIYNNDDNLYSPYDENGYHIYIKDYEEGESMFEAIPYKKDSLGRPTNIPEVTVPLKKY